jgi:ketosteroid isomerase-like protein
MPSINNFTLAVDQDVANAVIAAEWDIVWDAFDQATDLDYDEFFSLFEDDTFQDGDNLPIGDDPVSIGLQPIFRVSSNGQAVTHRTRNLTIAFSNLDKDIGVNEDDEIRAKVTLTPRLPVATSRESNVVTVTA